MFNLEEQISAWRNELSRARISPNALNELESHLRDEIDEQLYSGVDAQLAFETAVQRLGSPESLKPEFKKVNHMNVLLLFLRLALVIVAVVITTLLLWLDAGLRDFATVFCVLLCLALPLFAGPRPMPIPPIPKIWFRGMLAGQLCIGLGGTLATFVPHCALAGLALALFSCIYFIRELRRQSHAVLSSVNFAVRAKNAALSFAGIPNHHLYMNEPFLKLDSRWTTYLRSAAFLAPALCCWGLGIIYVIPQFNAVWQGTWAKLGNQSYSGFGIDKTLRTVLAILYLGRDNLIYIAAFTILMLALLEWRSPRWPRYRRAVIGAGVFLINLTVLLSLGIMFIAATIAAGNLLPLVKP